MKCLSLYLQDGMPPIDIDSTGICKCETIALSNKQLCPKLVFVLFLTLTKRWL